MKIKILSDMFQGIPIYASIAVFIWGDAIFSYFNSFISLLKFFKNIFSKKEQKEISADLQIIYDVFKYRDISIGHVTDTRIKYISDERIILKNVGSQQNFDRIRELFDRPIIYADDFPFTLFSKMAENADLLSHKLRKKLKDAGISEDRSEIKPQSGDLILGIMTSKNYISKNTNLSTLRDYYILLVEIKELIERETGKQLNIE